MNAPHPGRAPVSLRAFAQAIVRYRGHLVPRHVALQFEDEVTQCDVEVLAVGNLPALDPRHIIGEVLDADTAWSQLVADMNGDHCYP